MTEIKKESIYLKDQEVINLAQIRKILEDNINNNLYLEIEYKGKVFKVYCEGYNFYYYLMFKKNKGKNFLAWKAESIKRQPEDKLVLIGTTVFYIRELCKFFNIKMIKG